MKRKVKDIVVGSVVIAFGVFYFTQTLGIRKIPFIDPIVGSALFPRIIAGIIVLCGIAILVNGIKVMRKDTASVSASKKTLMDAADEAENGPATEDTSADAAAQKRKGNIKVALVLVSFALYAFFMDKIGFAAASFIYLVSQMVLMSQERPTKKRMVFYVILSAVLAAAIFSLFRYGFGLILPKARWF